MVFLWLRFHRFYVIAIWLRSDFDVHNPWMILKADQNMIHNILLWITVKFWSVMVCIAIDYKFIILNFNLKIGRRENCIKCGFKPRLHIFSVSLSIRKSLSFFTYYILYKPWIVTHWQFIFFNLFHITSVQKVPRNLCVQWIQDNNNNEIITYIQHSIYTSI